jgi:sialate O-acetylesterase
MKILTGLFPSIVFPRNQANVSEQAVTGTCRASGNVDATIFPAARKKPLMVLRNCGTAHGGNFSAQLDGIPCGGPYRIELVIGTETLVVEDVLVGEVWLLGGQSNMQGYGIITGKRPNTEPRIKAYYLDDRWGIAQEPIGRVEISRHQAHLRLMNPPVTSRSRKNPGNTGAEPGLPFALERYRQTGVPQGLIACAHGGTTIAMWDPKTKSQGYDSLYGAMIQRVLRNGGRVTGMLWYQGCSDATTEYAPKFAQATLEFFRALRRDLKAPDLPIVQAQLARQIYVNEESDQAWTAIREAQRLMPRRLRNLLTVPAVDLSTDDNIHLDEASHFILGRRMAQAMQTLLKEPGALPPPIELGRVVLKYHRAKGRSDLYLYYRNVVGELQSAGRPAGFVLGDHPRPLAHRIELQGNCVILKCAQDVTAFAYGFGQNPYCNITDEAGRSLPATALQTVAHSFVQGPYAQKVMLSEPLAWSGSFASLYHDASQKLKYSPAANEPPFNCFPDRIDHLNEEGVRFFRTTYQNDHGLELSLALGYDGNVKVFVDGKTVFLDENGRNPIIPASHLISQYWKPGRHEVVIAEAMSHGRTWGISLALATKSKNRSFMPTEVDA